MNRLILKNLWARRYRNGWLLAELIVVSIVIWVLADPVVVLTHDRSLPTGIADEGMYRISLATLPPSSARYDAAEDGKEARIANVRRMLSRVRDHKDVQSATLQFESIGPFCISSWNTGVQTDTTQAYYSFMQMFFEPQSDFFRTFGFEEVEGQTNEQLDRMPFGYKEMCMTTNPIPGEASLGFRAMDLKADTVKWMAKATVGKIRMRNGMQPMNVLMMPTTLDRRAANIPKDVHIVFRTKPGVSEGQFLHGFRQWANSNLRIGNLYMRSVKSYRTIIQEDDDMNGVYYTYRLHLTMAVFFLISLLLGVAGTFWMQTRSRREEVGVMKSFGARGANIVRMLLGEGWVLTTVATAIGCFLYLQYAVSENLYTNMWSETDMSPEYWVNNFWPHFFGVSAIVWAILLVVVSIGIYIPARSLSKITPVEALRDE